MKKFNLPMIMVVILTFGITIKSNAQQQSNGLYLTFNDYQNHKLSYGSIAKGDKIAIHDFLESNAITVISNGNKQTFPKKGIYGFRKNNQDYRFQDNKVYQIIDIAGFCLYKHDKLTQQNKGLKPVSTIYFSTKADDRIALLTQENIDKAFTANYKFRNSVQAEFKNDDALNEYDTSLGEYKIKELYAESTK